MRIILCNVFLHDYMVVEKLPTKNKRGTCRRGSLSSLPEVVLMHTLEKSFLKIIIMWNLHIANSVLCGTTF